MKKTFIAAALGILLGAAAGTSVQAQTPDTTVQKPISIKIGGFFPTSGTVKSATSNTWFKVGADYAFSKTDTANPLLTSAYVDFDDYSKSGTNANLTGIGVAAREYLSQTSTGPATGSSVSPYVGAGIGVYIAHASGGGASVTNTQLGGKVMLGAELNTGPFLEVGYNFVPKGFNVNGNTIHADGFDASLGYRF